MMFVGQTSTRWCQENLFIDMVSHAAWFRCGGNAVGTLRLKGAASFTYPTQLAGYMVLDQRCFESDGPLVSTASKWFRARGASICSDADEVGLKEYDRLVYYCISIATPLGGQPAPCLPLMEWWNTGT
ncbi:hypothetical protein BV22DRAFT_158968 [Leucogyrophana mollusca]|uniref:Uncharacterized protein n=1 Tax=Leucogyrophana mollusca TaxID=85980 RepID=A0ACB8BV98_9AGAM|nr:hypothetical protein BV22DRAFT_158968 [Leucogyrophana mollusca]